MKSDLFQVCYDKQQDNEHDTRTHARTHTRTHTRTRTHTPSFVAKVRWKLAALNWEESVTPAAADQYLWQIALFNIKQAKVTHDNRPTRETRRTTSQKKQKNIHITQLYRFKNSKEICH